MNVHCGENEDVSLTAKDSRETALPAAVVESQRGGAINRPQLGQRIEEKWRGFHTGRLSGLIARFVTSTCGPALKCRGTERKLYKPADSQSHELSSRRSSATINGETWELNPLVFQPNSLKREYSNALKALELMGERGG
ncbi:unnamed protein product [Heligmosomoides polygyrus]|uniref:Uncharacterized protein n=1 Tax=Heligmosomoides polygyrus TaxID=6339 RepID=A0A183GAT8_HELPZ|nr:unnamed protein product [Heligmosomoides polygyrus]